MHPGLEVVLAEARRSTRPPCTAPRLIAVDGPSGSGKSTLAVPLAASLDAPLVRIDDFVTWADFGSWWPRFDEEVVRPLLAGDDARYRVRDWAGDEFGDGLGDWRVTPWAPTVVLEGVTCSRAEIAPHLALAIWIEAGPDERLARGIRRDGECHRALWERWMREEEAFFTADGTKARADLVVDGSAD